MSGSMKGEVVGVCVLRAHKAGSGTDGSMLREGLLHFPFRNTPFGSPRPRTELSASIVTMTKACATCMLGWSFHLPFVIFSFCNGMVDTTSKPVQSPLHLEDCLLTTCYLHYEYAARFLMPFAGLLLALRAALNFFFSAGRRVSCPNTAGESLRGRMSMG